MSHSRQNSESTGASRNYSNDNRVYAKLIASNSTVTGGHNKLSIGSTTSNNIGMINNQDLIRFNGVT